MLFRALLLTLLSLSTSASWALAPEESIRVDGDVYRSGPALYEYYKENYGSFMPDPAGFMAYVEVPLDYNNIHNGTFKMSYRLPKALDPTKPTVLFFYGGPGGSSYGYNLESHLPDFNVIYFDQRGTGFSHLPTLEDAKNPNYTSSEFIARDADTLIQYLGIKKVSVWGHSYGTVVATIFSNLFAKKVTGVVLEGTVFNGSSWLWTAPHRLRIVQHFFKGLPEEMQKKILDISSSGQVNESWFSRMAQAAMYDDDFEVKFKNTLVELFKLEESALYSKIRSEINDSYYFIDSVFFGSYMFHQIACQELSWGDMEGTWNARFVNGVLTPAKNQNPEICLQLPGMEKRMNRIYKSTNYPLTVPVTYLQGTKDGATTADSAIFHYKQTAQKQAQIVLVKNTGHSPSMTCMNLPLKIAGCPNISAIADIVRTGLLGQELHSEQILRAGDNWKYAKKGFAP